MPLRQDDMGFVPFVACFNSLPNVVVLKFSRT